MWVPWESGNQVSHLQAATKRVTLQPFGILFKAARNIQVPLYSLQHKTFPCYSLQVILWPFIALDRLAVWPSITELSPSAPHLSASQWRNGVQAVGANLTPLNFAANRVLSLDKKAHKTRCGLRGSSRVERLTTKIAEATPACDHPRSMHCARSKHPELSY